MTYFTVTASHGSTTLVRGVEDRPKKQKGYSAQPAYVVVLTVVVHNDFAGLVRN